MDLREKALLALEEAVQECRYRKPRRSFAMRFALAYLWSTSRADRAAFDAFWQALAAEKSPWSFSAADNALHRVYIALGKRRDAAVARHLWRLRQAEESGERP
jgi:hypothetical protein